MPSPLPRALEVPVLAFAAVAAASLLLPLPLIGIPLMLMPVAWLLYTRRTVEAAVVSVVGAGGVVLMAALDSPKLFVPLVGAGLLAYVAVMAGGWWAALALRKRSAFVVVLAFGLVVLAATAGALALGLSLYPGKADLFGPAADAAARLLVEQATPGTPVEELVREVKRGLERTVPGMVVAMSLAASLLSVIAFGWTARKAEVEVHRIPALSDIDVSMHFVWPLIVSLALMAAAAFMKQSDGWMATAGDNLFVVSRLVMVVQGLAVAEFFMKKARVPTALRVLAYVFLATGPAAQLVAGFGTADLWANFRRLPRGGSSTPSASLEETSGRV